MLVPAKDLVLGNLQFGGFGGLSLSHIFSASPGPPMKDDELRISQKLGPKGFAEKASGKQLRKRSRWASDFQFDREGADEVLGPSSRPSLAWANFPSEKGLRMCWIWGIIP